MSPLALLHLSTFPHAQGSLSSALSLPGALVPPPLPPSQSQGLPCPSCMVALGESVLSKEGEVRLHFVDKMLRTCPVCENSEK